MQDQFNTFGAYPINSTSGYFPRGLTIDPVGNLYVADSWNNRVLIYRGGAFLDVNGPSATQVLGQTTFDTNNTGLLPNQMFRPFGVVFDPVTNTLWVADEDNKRMLGFITPTFQSLNWQSLSVLLAFDARSPNVHILPKGNEATNGVSAV
jgi:sugar lactone lactonase YvrE